MSMDAGPPADRIDVREYLWVLRRRWLLIAVTTVLVAGVSLGQALLETPLYRSAATVAVEPSTIDSNGQGDQLSDQEMDTQLQILASEEVAAVAADILGIGVGPRGLLGRTGAQRIGDTRVVQVAAIDADAQRAADIAQAFAEAYLQVRREGALDRVLEATTALQGRLESVRGELQEVEREIATTLDEVRRTALERQRDVLDDQLLQLNSQIVLLDATDSFVRGGGEIIRAATPAGRPISPQPVRSGVVGVLVGLVLGIALAFVRDRFDDAVRSDGDVVRALDGKPVLGHVPPFDEEEDGEEALELLTRPNSIAAEAIRTLRTNVRFAVGRQSLRSLLVTSPGEGEGKSTIVANLAIAAARSNQRVLLIDADLRRPAVHRAFGLPNGEGTSSALTGEQRLRDLLVDVGVPGLRVMTAGVRPPNPAELLADGMPHLVREAMELADVVMIDGPPALAVADSLEVSRTVEATLLVVAYGLTGHRATAEAGRRLTHVAGNLVGAVINVAAPELDYYGYYYGPAITPEGSRRGRRADGDGAE